MHRGTKRCEHRSNHQMRCTPSEPSANKPPSLHEVPANSTRVGAAPRAPGGARQQDGNRALTSQPHTGQSPSYRDMKSAYQGASWWDRSGCAKRAPRSANRQGEEQHRHIERGSHMVDGRDSAWRSRAPRPHTHRNTARQIMDGLWTEARGRQKQSNDLGNNQHNLNTPTTGRR